MTGTSTSSSLLGALFDITGINRRFHRYEPIPIDPGARLISPVEARVAHIGTITSEGMLLSKRGKEVSLGALIGERARDFSGGSYVNFYLSPRNRHFWVTPCCGRFIHTHCNEGKAVLPVFIGLEGVLGIELFPAAARQNASIGSLFATQGYDLALVAVGSLNVNRIHVTYEQGVQYSQGTPCGYFSIGSSMLLCLPFTSTFRVTTGDSVRIGQRVL